MDDPNDLKDDRCQDDPINMIEKDDYYEKIGNRRLENIGTYLTFKVQFSEKFLICSYSNMQSISEHCRYLMKNTGIILINLNF